MRIRTRAAVVAALALGLTAASAARAQTVLYDQTDNASGNGAPDQNFEAAFDIYDSQAADDFSVPPPGWSITSLDTVGTTGTAGMATVDVTVFTNSPGGGDADLPGSPICTYSAITPTDTTGSLAIALPSPCVLASGTYWLNVQTNQDFGTAGQHFWSNRTVQSGNEGVWRNPADGFVTGCTTFTPQTTCGVGGGAAPDFLFSITGDTLTTTTTSTTSSTTTTTTTLPPGSCGGQAPSASFASLACRLSELVASVGTASDLGKLQPKILKAAAAAEKKRAKAETLCGGGDARKAAKQLRKASRKMRKFTNLAQRVTAALGGELLSRGQAIQTDLETLDGAVTCP